MGTTKGYLVLMALLLLAASCKSEKKEQSSQEDSISDSSTIIEVVAKDFTFTVADSIPSGWSTFRMKNTGMMDHFFLLTKMPDSLDLDDYINGVGAAFGVAWEALKANKSKEEAFGLLGQNLPEWYSKAVAMGGAGLISSGETAINTLNLSPGYYVMECYIKAANGQFHTELGMITSLIVTDQLSTTTPPEATIKISLTNEEMVIEGEPKSGKNIFAVHFDEQQPFGLGNDIHVIKLDASTNIDDVTYWMDWSNLTGMISPGAPAKFIGGTQEMPTGFTAYFQCDLSPGEYAFVAETPIGRFNTFTVN